MRFISAINQSNEVEAATFIMKLSIATFLAVVCLFQIGSASEISSEALKTTREFKDQVKRLNSFLENYLLEYAVELNENLDNAENQYKEHFNQEVHSVLDEIKSAIAQKKAPVPKKCYEAAKSRFDQLNVTSSKAVEQCSVSKENGVDPDNVLDSIVTLVGHGNKLYEYVEKLEKEVETSNEFDLKTFEEKRVPAVKASLAFFDFAINGVMRRVEKILDASKNQAEECNEKELADVHVIALYVRENAYNCINQA